MAVSNVGTEDDDEELGVAAAAAAGLRRLLVLRRGLMEELGAFQKSWERVVVR